MFLRRNRNRQKILRTASPGQRGAVLVRYYSRRLIVKFKMLSLRSCHNININININTSCEHISKFKLSNSSNSLANNIQTARLNYTASRFSRRPFKIRLWAMSNQEEGEKSLPLAELLRRRKNTSRAAGNADSSAKVEDVEDEIKHLPWVTIRSQVSHNIESYGVQRDTIQFSSLSPGFPQSDECPFGYASCFHLLQSISRPTRRLQYDFEARELNQKCVLALDDMQ